MRASQKVIIDLQLSVQAIVFSFFFSSRRRHTRFDCDWSSDVCSSDLNHTLRERRDASRGGGGNKKAKRWQRHKAAITDSSNAPAGTGSRDSRATQPNADRKSVV